MAILPPLSLSLSPGWLKIIPCWVRGLGVRSGGWRGGGREGRGEEWRREGRGQEAPAGWWIISLRDPLSSNESKISVTAPPYFQCLGYSCSYIPPPTLVGVEGGGGGGGEGGNLGVSYRRPADVLRFQKRLSHYSIKRDTIKRKWWTLLMASEKTF